MNPERVAKLLTRLGESKTRVELGAAIAAGLVEHGAGDIAIVWVPRDPAAPPEPADFFVEGTAVQTAGMPQFLDAAAARLLPTWMSVHRAVMATASAGSTPLIPTVIVGWLDSANRPASIEAWLAVLAGHAEAILARQRAEQEIVSISTTLRTAESQILRTRRVRALGEMASGIVHDFNNCLTTILGYAELALGPMGDTDPYFADLSTIRLAAIDAAALVRRMQALGRRTQSGDERELTDVSEIANVMPDLVKPRWTRRSQVDGVRFDVVVDVQSTPPVYVVVAEIRELLLNLLFNAIDAMPLGGRVVISTRMSDSGVQIAVKDEGIGMPEEVQALLFQPFFSTKGEDGSGLGLSVCRNIAQRHGGRLTVQSAPGEGSTFTLSLPQAPAELLKVASDEAAPSPASGPAVGRRILLVDDQGEVRDSVGQMLRALGHSVVAAADGPSGLSIALAQRVDVVLTDFGMPGMNGVEFARRLAGVAPHVPVVLITGWGLDQDTPPPANVAFVLGKPVSMKDLREALSACAVEKLTQEAGRAKCS